MWEFELKVDVFFHVRDLRKFKEVKKQFDKASEEKEVALVKNAQVPRNKPHEVDEATNILTTTRKCFRHISLDYVLQVSEVTWGHSVSHTVTWEHINKTILCVSDQRPSVQEETGDSQIGRD